MKHKKLKVFLLVVFVLLILIALAIWQRHTLIAHLYKNENPALLEKADQGDNVQWFDDYYTIQKLSPNVYAIGEPRYWQRNYNYLIIGDERALLIDAGPGVRDIRPVVKSITNLPFTLINTHFHFDHMGNGFVFPHQAIIDLPHIRDRIKEGVFKPTVLEHLGKPEGYELPSLSTEEWVKPNSTIDLGKRKVDVIYTPGHTVESISIYDRTSNILFTGDWFTPVLGPMFSNSNMGGFLLATENVLCLVPKDARVFGAHKYVSEGGAPEQSMGDIKNVKNGLKLIHDKKIKGEGFYPTVYQVAPDIELYADIALFQNWKPVYPDLKPVTCN